MTVKEWGIYMCKEKVFGTVQAILMKSNIQLAAKKNTSVLLTQSMEMYGMCAFLHNSDTSIKVNHSTYTAVGK